MRGQTNASNIGGTVGDDLHPIKIINSVPVPIPSRVLVDPVKTPDISTGGADLYPTFWTITDSNGREVLIFKLHYLTDGRVEFYVRIRNADNTWRDVGLA